MKKDFLPLLIVCFICSCISFQAYAQEKVFAAYFDIPTNSPDSVLADGQSLRHRGDAHRHHLPRRLRQNDRYGHRRLYLRRHVLRRQPV